MITIKDLAKIAGVNSSTVSRALNDSPLISKETIERIKKIANKNNYKRNFLAQGLKKKNTDIIAFIGLKISNPFFEPIIAEIDKYVTSNSYNLIICDSQGIYEKERDYINKFIEMRVSGIIITPTNISNEYIDTLKFYNIPFLLLDKPLKNYQCNYVTFDDFRGAYISTKYLLETGHRDIWCISSGPINRYPWKYRIEGYYAALKEYNIPFNNNFIFECKGDIQSGYELANLFFKTKKKPTAIFTFNDLIAIGFMDNLLSNGIDIPKDVSIIGFDDIEFSAYTKIPLTTVSLPAKEIGKQSAEIIIKMVKEKNQSKNFYNIEIEPKLVIRESTK